MAKGQKLSVIEEYRSLVCDVLGGDGKKSCHIEPLVKQGAYDWQIVTVELGNTEQTDTEKAEKLYQLLHDAGVDADFVTGGTEKDLHLVAYLNDKSRLQIRKAKSMGVNIPN